MSIHEHKLKRIVNCMVLTVSDTRSEKTDKSGKLMVDLLEQAGHTIKFKHIVPDEKHAIEKMVDAGCENPEIDVILTNGGTGMSYRDITYETVKLLLDKEMVGFGEIFRFLSYQEDIGSAAILSRAIAGVRNHTAIFAMPGSSGAVKLAMNKLVIPELSHVVNELKKDIEPKK